jgi:2-keto-4-pentenoate hydratase/2-oxohepta-3-ene-1,7-dioic acid hydratase in catechol pathway
VKLATFHRNGEIKIGAVLGRSLIDLSGVAPDMMTLIELGASGFTQAESAVKSAQSAFSLEEVELLAPIPNIRRNVMCVGLNYAEHTAEHYKAMGRESKLPEFPVIFNKATTSVNSPYGDILLDRNVTEELDWEVELAVIIGRTGKNILEHQAMKYVFGYCVLNDISARDLQRNHKQFFKGKSLDGSCPMGPWIVATDEMPSLKGLTITSRVNGVTKQKSTTDHMIFDVPALIYHLSRGMTLLPGDIIATGTPGGVGFARTPPEFLSPGDVVECEIEGIGLLRNAIVDASV